MIRQRKQMILIDAVTTSVSPKKRTFEMLMKKMAAKPMVITRAGVMSVQ